jgi:hypothetical protein
VKRITRQAANLPRVTAGDDRIPVSCVAFSSPGGASTSHVMACSGQPHAACGTAASTDDRKAQAVAGHDATGHDANRGGHDMKGTVAPARRDAAALASAVLAVPVILATLAIPPAPAFAATPDATGPAPQLAGLFVQSCLPYAGDPAGLRAWAAKTGLPTVPETASKIFLHGAPGTVFDASLPPEKFVVISSDDGLCATVTNQAEGDAVVTALEGDLKFAGVAFRLAIERDDKQQPQIHNREYLATKNGRGWRILVATVKDSKGGQAMLTAAPE